MPILSSDTLQLAIVEEVTPGVTPATPAFDLIRATSESLTFAPNTSDSAELTGSGTRCKLPSNVTGQTVSGDISFELAPAPWVDIMFGAVMGSEWDVCPLTGAAGGLMNADTIAVGDTVRTFTIEKRFPDPEDPLGYLYQWYRGCTLSALTLEITPNEAITGSVTVIGGVPELGTGNTTTAGIPGSTYTPAGSDAIFTAPKVSELTVGSDLAVGTSCWTSATITLDSQNRGIPCIGSVGDREVVLGTLAATLGGEVYFNDNAIMQAMLDNATVGDSTVILDNGASGILRFDFYSTKPIEASVVTPGTGQDMTMPLTLEPAPVVVCDDGAGNDWRSSVIISKIAAPPAIP